MMSSRLQISPATDAHPDFHLQRILITRLSAIGDCILTLPLACALRRAFPHAQIEWIVERPSHALLEGHDCIDRLHVLSKGWLKSVRQVAAIRRTLRSRHFDAVLDPQGLTRSALLGWLSGASMRVCLEPPLAREVAPWLATHRVTPEARHVAQRQLALLQPWGVETDKVEFRLPSYPAAAATIQRWLADRGLGPFAVLNPGASWPTKLWLPERFAQVAQALWNHHRLPSVVVWAGAAERTMAESIVRLAGDSTTVAPETSLTELAELLRRSNLMVSSDTGPLHLAVAAGTPTVGLYGPTRPEVCGPFGPAHRAVQAWYQGGSSRRRKRGTNEAMRAISVEMVLDACHDVLQRASQARKKASRA